MQRITIVGTPGAGKSTLAQQISVRYHIPFIEFDALFWGPAWAAAPPDEFRANVTRALAPQQWVVGGNYSSARDIIWQRSDTLIWLDYPLPFVFARLLRRTLLRIISKEELWSGNHETWREQFLSRDSLLLFALQTHYTRRKQFMNDLVQPAYRQLTLLRFTHDQATAQWLATLAIHNVTHER